MTPQLELHSRIRNAYFWTVIGSFARYAAGFAISIILARLLKPEDYGLIGMTIVCTDLLSVVYDWGLGKAVVHLRENGGEQERPTYFTISLLIGTSFAILLFASAPVIARFYGEPRLVLLLRVMSLIMIPGSIKTVSASILTRELRFRELSFADVFSSVTAGLTAIGLAYLGFGVWSLVTNLFLFCILQLIIYGWYVPPSFTLQPHREVALRLGRYGAPVIGSSVLSSMYNNADYITVGKLLGSGSLGYYSVAFRLATLINDRISAVINRVAFPSFAALRDDRPQMIAHWFLVTKRVTLITFPLLVWLGMNAEDFVNLILGHQWLPAVLPLRFFCAMTAVRIATNVVEQILTAAGHPTVVFRYDIVSAIVLPISFIVACKSGGLLGLGIAWCTIYPLVRLFFLLSARRALGFSLRGYAQNLLDSLLVCAICGICMAPALWLAASGWLRFGLSSLLWVVAVLVAIAVNRSLRLLVKDVVSNPSKMVSLPAEPAIAHATP